MKSFENITIDKIRDSIVKLKMNGYKPTNLICSQKAYDELTNLDGRGVKRFFGMDINVNSSLKGKEMFVMDKDSGIYPKDISGVYPPGIISISGTPMGDAFFKNGGGSNVAIGVDYAKGKDRTFIRKKEEKFEEEKFEPKCGVCAILGHLCKKCKERGLR